MRKDIPDNKVENVAVAVIREKEKGKASFWQVYLINYQHTALEQVLISSKGQGTLKGVQRKSSVLRQAFGDIEPQSFVGIEILPEELLSFSNEYLVSYWQHGKLFDKKYIFVPGSISKQLIVKVPLLDKSGIMIK